MTAFAGLGQPTVLDAGVERVFTSGAVLFTWDAGGGAVTIQHDGGVRALPSAGQESLELQGDVRFIATGDGCSTEHRFLLSSKPSLEVQTVFFDDRTRGEAKVVLDAPAPARTTLSVSTSNAKGVTVPRTVVVEKGQTVATLPITSSGPLAPLPAVSVSAPGYVPTGPRALQKDERPRGFADLHVHMFANLGFGTTGFYGRPDGPPDVSLRECSAVHGPWGVWDLLNVGTKVASGLPWQYQGIGHRTDGAYSYLGWPDALDYTHQQVHAEALKRAWQGGLRLMVLLAVNNQEGCHVAPLKNRAACDDMGAVRRQLKAAQAFANSPQAQGWFRIVKSSAEARDALARGQLAVVLGVEVDTLGECVEEASQGRHCTDRDLDPLLDELDSLGVRHVFPVHFLTNGFGGSALYNALTHPAEDEKPGPCPPGPVRYDYPNDAFPQCNRQGLSALGKTFIRKLIARRWIIDLDHQSLQSRTDTLRIAKENTYPVVSGHAWLTSLMQNHHRHEGTLSREQQQQVYALGGMVGLLTNQADHLDDLADAKDAFGKSRLPQHCGKSVEALAQAILEANQGGLGPIAFGSDFNGFAGQPSGRGTLVDRDRACVGGARPSNWKPAPSTLVTYPFRTAQNVTLDRSVFGNRRYDVNTDGFAHVGMYPDLLEALRKVGLSDDDLLPVMTSADGYVRMWERIDSPHPVTH